MLRQNEFASATVACMHVGCKGVARNFSRGEGGAQTKCVLRIAVNFVQKCRND